MAGPNICMLGTMHNIFLVVFWDLFPHVHIVHWTAKPHGERVQVSVRLREGFLGSNKVVLYPSRRAWRPPGPQTTGLATRTDSFVRSSFSYTSANYFYLVKFVDTNLTILRVFIHNRFGYQTCGESQERTTQEVRSRFTLPTNSTTCITGRMQ